MRGAAKGDLFSWKIRPEGRLFFHSYFPSLLKKTHDFFSDSLKADPPKGTYFFDRFEVMRWLTDKI